MGSILSKAPVMWNPMAGSSFQTLRLVVRQLYLLGQIALVGTAEVQLVAILLRLHAAEDGLELGQFHLADARQLVVHLLLLHAKLFVVGHLLPLTSSAHAEMLAEGFRAYLTIFVVADYLGFHERMLLAAHLQVDNVARYGPRNKHHHVVDACHRFTLGGKVRDFYML